jgi:hypothetical protein
VFGSFCLALVVRKEHAVSFLDGSLSCFEGFWGEERVGAMAQVCVHVRHADEWRIERSDGFCAFVDAVHDIHPNEFGCQMVTHEACYAARVEARIAVFTAVIFVAGPHNHEAAACWVGHEGYERSSYQDSVSGLAELAPGTLASERRFFSGYKYGTGFFEGCMHELRITRIRCGDDEWVWRAFPGSKRYGCCKTEIGNIEADFRVFFQVADGVFYAFGVAFIYAQRTC